MFLNGINVLNPILHEWGSEDLELKIHLEKGVLVPRLAARFSPLRRRPWELARFRGVTNSESLPTVRHSPPFTGMQLSTVHMHSRRV